MTPLHRTSCVLVLMTCTVAAQPAPAPSFPALPPGTRALVVEIAGQSNAVGVQSAMAGHASLWEQLPLATRTRYLTSAQGAVIWDAFGAQPAYRFERLEPGYSESGGGPGTPTAHIGPEMSIVDSLVRTYGLPIFVIKYAIGGTQLELAPQYRDWSPASQGEFFDTWKDDYSVLARRAIVQLGFAANEVVHLGCVWAQGYNDARAMVGAQYQGNLTTFIDQARQRFLDPASAFVVVRTVRPINPPVQIINDLLLVRQAQVTVANATPHCVWSNSDNLFLWDGLHLDAQAQLDNGHRIATALLSTYAQGTPYRTLDQL